MCIIFIINNYSIFHKVENKISIRTFYATVDTVSKTYFKRNNSKKNMQFQLHSVTQYDYRLLIFLAPVSV